jgi:2-polyprenyl-3-methyl-5-hydroxy-6-metoxy-1,4-benzoquinol methylase
VSADADAERVEELRQIVLAVKERVRARYSGPTANGGDPAVRVGPADLMPVVHARDAAQSRIAAIGSVNPRAGGVANRVIQAVKKLVARSLQWFVREQVVFNREIVSAVEATLEALNQHNRAIADIATQASAAEWRTAMEQKLAASEIQLLRTVAELQGAFQYRATQIESNFHDMLKSQHANYLGALDRASVDTQKRLWADMEKIRWQYERMIHTELRLIRQRAARAADVPAQASVAPPPSGAPALDYARFAERFRGPQENVRKSHDFYKTLFEGRASVLDIGCGRGEFLEMMRSLGVPAKGIDLSDESVAECRSKGLDAEMADLFTMLDGATDGEFDGIFCSQVVEHLDPLLLPKMISLCAEKLSRGGVMAIETPNPECLAIFASFFYLDPTHARPVPAPLLEFYMTEAGLSEIETHPLSPAIEMFPEVGELPEAFRKRFFGGLDYAIIGRKL